MWTTLSKQAGHALLESEVSEKIGQLKALDGLRVLQEQLCHSLNQEISSLLHVAHDTPDLF